MVSSAKSSNYEVHEIRHDEITALSTSSSICITRSVHYHFNTLPPSPNTSFSSLNRSDVMMSTMPSGPTSLPTRTSAAAACKTTDDDVEDGEDAVDDGEDDGGDGMDDGHELAANGL